MKAITQTRYGPAEVLRLADIDQPAIGDNEVLVAVRAAAVDPGVWVQMTGQPYMVRAFGFGLRRPKVKVRGRDLAGVVAAVGAGVSRFRVGDEVHGTSTSGSLAQFAVAPQDQLATKPAGLSFEAAAAVPVSGLTAWQAVRQVVAVQPGQRVLVVGAGGGVGSYVVQIAKASGATVTGVCSTAKTEFVRSLGADDVIDYTRAEVDRDGPSYDVVFDIAGCRPLRLLCRALTRRGTLALVGGGHDTGGLLGGFWRQLGSPLVSMVESRRIRMVLGRERGADLEALDQFIAAGSVTPAIDRIFPLAETPAAIRYLTTGRAAGKIAISVA